MPARSIRLRRAPAGNLDAVAEFRARYSSAYESVGAARRAITDFARTWFSGPDLGDIEFAAGEALANAAEHGAKTSGFVDVEADCVHDRFTIIVKDMGEGFERWNAADYIKPLSDAPRGYGMFIMRELMDEIEYSEHGTRLRLMKRLPNALSSFNERRRA